MSGWMRGEESVLAVDGEGAEEVGEEVDADPEQRLRVVRCMDESPSIERLPAGRGSCPSFRPPILNSRYFTIAQLICRGICQI